MADPFPGDTARMFGVAGGPDLPGSRAMLPSAALPEQPIAISDALPPVSSRLSGAAGEHKGANRGGMVWHTTKKKPAST
jgi:hypothetical protein